MTEQLAHHPQHRPADRDATAAFERLDEAEERQRVQQLTVDNWDDWPKRHRVRIEPAEVTGRWIDPTPLHGITRCSLPTVAEWTGRDVWLPPTPAGVRR